MVLLRGWITPERLAKWVIEARRRTIDLVSDLTHEQLFGPRLPITNPLLWTIGHVGWFQERWVLRHVCKEPPIREDGDSLWDSSAVPHDIRWDLPLPSFDETVAYLLTVRDRVLEKLHEGDPSDELLYFVLYSVFHEDMHNESMTYTRQTLGYPPPKFTDVPGVLSIEGGGPLPGDVSISGGEFLLGATKEEPFVFDNEKWAHPVQIKPFRIAKAPVTQGEFLAFVEEGGYHRKEFWSEEGWGWRMAVGAEHPIYWRRERNGQWFRRHFDQWLPLEPDKPVIHVSWYEAEAYCRWAERRLPTEAEWELAATGGTKEGAPSSGKRRFPWGNDSPTPEKANLEGWAMGCVDVGSFPKGESPFGCRQMIGNVWEWTSSPFLPYPGFVPDAYKDYSQPWFGTRKVLRGGSWATRARNIRNTWRNFYTPDRRDIFAGFRTCASDE